MGYRSDIRIKLRKTDFEDLEEQYNKEMLVNNKRLDKIHEQIKNCDDEETKTKLREQLNTTYMASLFDENWLYVCKTITDTIYDDDDYDSEQEDKIVYFGWNSLKWYGEYTDVRFIKDFVRSCNYYAFAIVGEEYGDIDKEERGMYSIGTYTSFEDDE